MSLPEKRGSKAAAVRSHKSGDSLPELHSSFHAGLPDERLKQAKRYKPEETWPGYRTVAVLRADAVLISTRRYAWNDRPVNHA